MCDHYLFDRRRVNMVPVIVSVFFLVCAHAHAGQLQEGAACDVGGVPGVCRRAASCPSYGALAPYHADTEVKTCSKNGNKVVVCCTDCKIDETGKAAAPALTLDGVVWKTGGVRKSYDKCVDYAASLPYSYKNGKKITPKKVYDEEKKCHRLDIDVTEDNEASAVAAERVDFPNLALLGFAYNATELPRWLCQGFIISERFIISTAHCGKDFANDPVSVVAVGINEHPEPGTPAPAPANWQIHKVKRFIAHPDWHAPAKYNDIGLLETETEIKFSVSVLPLCLSEQAVMPDAVHADILGVHGGRDNEKVQIQKLDQKECSAVIPPSRHLKDGINYDTQACYRGFNEAKEVCIGSSGRPIYVPGDLKCMNYAVGFTSFGLTCDVTDAITVYTRIHDYLPWIESTVWP